MPPDETNANPEAIRNEWIDRLNKLVGDIETWAGSFDWSTRRIDKSMKDPTIGPYKAPGLVMQKAFTRILLDPISRTTPGSDGAVDMYIMPALDDIASLYFYEGRWNVHYRLPNNEAVAAVCDAQAKPLTKETLREVLDEMARHGAETLDWIRSLKAIEHEYRVANGAMRRLAEQARHDPTILDRDMRVRGISDALVNIDGTYGIRLFAEFETGLRKFWATTRIEAEPRSIAEIIDRIAAQHGIGHAELTHAHRVRQYRNRQIHDNEEEGETLEVNDCRSFLCTFLGKMPPTWEPPTP